MLCLYSCCTIYTRLQVCPPIYISELLSFLNNQRTSDMPLARLLYVKYFHQAIIKKIADERRRRAQDVRRSWSEGPSDAQLQPSSSMELSASAIQSNSPVIYSSTSQSSMLPQQQHRNASPSNTPSSAGAESSSNSGAAFRDAPSPARAQRRTAWGTSPVPLVGKYEAPRNRFPFPRSGRGRRWSSGRHWGYCRPRPSRAVVIARC